METVVLSSDKIKSMLAMKSEGMLTSLKNLIYFDKASDEDKENAAEVGINLHSYTEFVEAGAQLADADAEYERHQPVTPETFYTFSYTSGTTGVPKGVMLTHRNFVCNIGGMSKFDGGQFSLRPDDVYISYLPLAHVFERFMYLCMVAHGISVGFYHGDVFKLKDDLAEL